jgi:hypothetical protein
MALVSCSRLAVRDLNCSTDPVDVDEVVVAVVS